MPKFGEVISWQDAFSNPMPDELTTKIRIHSRKLRCHRGLDS